MRKDVKQYKYMVENKKVRKINIHGVKPTELPHEGLPGGEMILHPSPEQMGWVNIEIAVATVEPGHGYTPGVSKDGPWKGMELPLETSCDEAVYFVSGEYTLYWGDNQKTVFKAGDFQFLPKGTRLHKAVNEGTESCFAVYAMYSPDLRGHMKNQGFNKEEA